MYNHFCEVGIGTSVMSPALLFYNEVISDKFEDLLRNGSLQLVRIGYLLCHEQCNFC